jgi:hypothetical protein
MQARLQHSLRIILFFKCELIIFDRTDQRKREQTLDSIIK